jgi:hypothetical protein
MATIFVCADHVVTDDQHAKLRAYGVHAAERGRSLGTPCWLGCRLDLGRSPTSPTLPDRDQGRRPGESRGIETDTVRMLVFLNETDQQAVVRYVCPGRVGAGIFITQE